jgi:hypothetical protein
MHAWKVVGRVVAWQRPATTCPTIFHACITRGCQCSFRLLMMGGVSPETRWALYKYEKNYATLCHFVGFSIWNTGDSFLGKTLLYAVWYILNCWFSILFLGLMLWSPIYEACILFNTNCVSFVATTCSLQYLTQTFHVEKRIALCGTQPLISRSNHTRINRMACTAVTLNCTCTDITYD